MFSYYGSKSKIIKYYPKPVYGKIIEPFAGSARYSLLNFEKDITIVDLHKPIIDLWLYLQKASQKDILDLPVLVKGENLSNYKYLSQVEKDLIGFHLRRGTARPGRSIGDRCSWERDKIKIAENLYKIKHWEIIEGSYEDLENKKATWFIDPPYFKQSHGYNKKIKDFGKLANWCKERKGQVIVCENESGKWLDFKPLVTLNGTNRKFTECIWTNTDSENCLF